MKFDVDALARAGCHAVGRHLTGVASITKLAEGGFNRVLQITFNDGYAVLVRLPYKTTVPKQIQKCLEDYRQEQEKLLKLSEMRNVIGTDAPGWVSDDDELERCRAVIQSIGLMEHSSTEMEKTVVQHYFPFDDHKEYS